MQLTMPLPTEFFSEDEIKCNDSVVEELEQRATTAGLDILFHGFEQVKFFKNEVSDELIYLIENYKKLKPKEIESLTNQIAFDFTDFNFLVETLVAAKDSLAQDVAIGLLSKFSSEYFDHLIEFLQNQVFDYYGSLYLIEVVENWDGIAKSRRIDALKKIASDKHYSLLLPGILKVISNITSE